MIDRGAGFISTAVESVRDREAAGKGISPKPVAVRNRAGLGDRKKCGSLSWPFVVVERYL